MTRKWTPAEEAMLATLYPTGHNDEIAEALNAEFGTSRTANSVCSHARVLSIRKADGYKRKMPRPFWTDEKRAWFREFVPGHHESEISAEHERIYGTPLTGSQIGNMKSILGVKSGTDGWRFRRGLEPWNKGKTWDELGISEESRERIGATQFKPGEVHVAPSRERPVGFERIGKDGYIEVKVRDSRIDGLQAQEPGRFNENYRMKHHVAWERANGRPVPPSTMIVFADRDKRNFDPANLVAVPRRLWVTISRENMPYWDAESLRTCMRLAELASASRKAQMGTRGCRACGKAFEPRYPHQRRCDACLGREDGDDER